MPFFMDAIHFFISNPELVAYCLPSSLLFKCLRRRGLHARQARRLSQVLQIRYRGIADRAAGCMRAASCYESGCANMTGGAGRNPHLKFFSKNSGFSRSSNDDGCAAAIFNNECLHKRGKYIPIYII